MAETFEIDQALQQEAIRSGYGLKFDEFGVVRPEFAVPEFKAGTSWTEPAPED